MNRILSQFGFTVGVYPNFVMVCCADCFLLIRHDGKAEVFRYEEFEKGVVK